MKIKLLAVTVLMLSVALGVSAQTSVTEIAFRNSDGGDDTDPYRMRKVQTSSNYNYLELQLNDDADESFRIYGNSCVGFGCGTYSGNLYHMFDVSGNAFHAGKLGLGGNASTRLHIIDGLPSGAQSLNSLTKFTIDAANGGFIELRNSVDNNTQTGLLFTDNNLGGYVAFRNAPDDKLHLGAYGGISFESGPGESVGGKTERMRIDANGNVGIGTTTPGVKLTVQGSGGANVDFAVNGRITTGDASNMGGVWVSGTSNMFMGQSSTTSMGWYNNGAWRMIVDNAGKIGVGTASPDQLLTVNGTIHSKEVKVDLSVPAPDYVFEKDYNLPSLEEIKTYIDQNKHLPEVPSAKEIEANGVQLGVMNMILLKKIEELTLYVIKVNKENEELKTRMTNLESSKH